MNPREVASRFAELKTILTELEYSVRQVLDEVGRGRASFDGTSLARDLSSVLEAHAAGRADEVIQGLAEKYSKSRRPHRPVRPGRVFARIYQAQEALVRAWSASSLPGKTPRRLRTGIQDFEKAFERYIADSSGAEVLALYQSARDLLTAIHVAQDLVTSLVESLRQPREITDEQAQLEIAFVSAPNAVAVAAKLQALIRLYEILSEFTGISVEREPLIVESIESGSIIKRLIGERRTTGILSRLLESAAGYAYRNYTKEGQIASIPTKAQSAEAVLRLAEKLESAGVDVTEIKDNVSRAAVQLSKELNKLMAGESAVEVNGELYSLPGADVDALAKAPDQLLLGPGVDEDLTEL